MKCFKPHSNIAFSMFLCSLNYILSIKIIFDTFGLIQMSYTIKKSLCLQQSDFMVFRLNLVTY